MRAEIDPLNRIIDGNMRRLRLARGMTQTELSAYVSVTQQQLQK
jgi:transcriptional regulator with XRE-family HTH domain